MKFKYARIAVIVFAAFGICAIIYNGMNAPW